MSIDVSAENFTECVIERSMAAPVIVDFWAPWCAPCRALGPVLEKLEAEYRGRFTLVKVNSDENQALAAQYGVRGIPNVKAFVHGHLVDEFSGALPEAAVRQFLDRVIPSPAEELRLQAGTAYREEKDATKALGLLADALGMDATNDRARLDAAAILIELERLDEAKQHLDRLAPLAQMDERAAALRARIDFAASAAGAPGIETLQSRIAANANDLDARLQLARLHGANQDYRAALDQLLEIVRRDRGFRDDIARKTMLDVFKLLGNEGEVVSEYRRRLASAMY